MIVRHSNNMAGPDVEIGITAKTELCGIVGKAIFEDALVALVRRDQSTCLASAAFFVLRETR